MGRRSSNTTMDYISLKQHLYNGKNKPPGDSDVSIVKTDLGTESGQHPVHCDQVGVGLFL